MMIIILLSYWDDDHYPVRWVDGEMVVREGREEEGWKELEEILDKK